MTKPSTKPAAKAERFDVYVVEGDENAYWTKIGSAWQHNDGDGFSVQLSAYPVNGRLTIRKAKPKTATQGESR